jgi:hypothetical protein
MASVSSLLRRIKRDLNPFLPERAIRQACTQVGHQWRNRLFDPVITLHLFILQILNFNTAITHLRHLAKLPINAASYCKARMRLPLAAVQLLLASSARAMAGGKEARRLWHGLRVLLTDGSGTIAPDTPDLQKQFPQSKSQKKGCGFPQVKILGLFDAFTGLVLEALCFSLFHEQSQVWRLHPLLGPGDLLVADRGLCSYVHLAMLEMRGVLGLFRMHQRQIVDFRPHRRRHRRGQTGRAHSRYVKRLGKRDHLVQWLKPKQRPRWMQPEQWAQIPTWLLVRELRYTLAARGQRTRVVTIATNLLDPIRYPKADIAALYGVRWTVETHFAELKTTLKMQKVKTQTPLGVQKEVAVYCLVYNLIHVVMLAAARRQGVDPGRISFLDAVRWLLSAQPGEPLPDLVVNPLRSDRHEPRVIKNRQDNKYRPMNKPRAALRKALKRQGRTH